MKRHASPTFTLLLVIVSLSLSASTVFSRTYEVGSCSTCNCFLGNCATLDSALVYVQDGDRIHMSAGTYVAPSGGWHITKSIELFGDGAGDKAGGATRLMPNAPGGTPAGAVIVLEPNTVSGSADLENVNIHDLQLLGQTNRPTSAISGQYGITWQQSGGKSIEDLRLSRLYIGNMGDDGINLKGVGSTFVVVADINDVEVMDCLGDGIELYQCTATNLIGDDFHRCDLTGGNIGGCEGIRIIGSTFEDNDLASPNQGKAMLQVDSSHGFVVQGCHFEQFDHGAALAIRVDNDLGGYIGSCLFSNPTATTSRGIWLSDSGTNPANPVTGIVIGPNAWQLVDTLVTCSNSDSIRSCTVFPQSVWTSTGVASRIQIPEAVDRGNVIYAATSSTSSLTAGVALPRLSATKRDAMTAVGSGGTRREGLLIYDNTARRMEHWDGRKWLAENASVFGADTNFTSRGSDIASTNLLLNPVAGFYRVTIYGDTQTTLSNNGESINLTWTDEHGSRTNTYTLPKQPTGLPVQVAVPVYLNSGNVSFSTTGNLSSGTYALHIRVEAMP